MRGRAGRQGDAGESRFYLSLEDELMRLFATGLMSRVMNASFPDDMPLESKMVSRAVERAQGTVEDRNFEIRKNVLKYDEVMNEQRKVIYRRRQQILDGEDLGDDAILAIESAISRLVEQYCLGEYFEDWDVPGLLDAARLYYPTRITKEQIDDVIGREALEETFVDDAKALYAEKGEPIGVETLRDIERRVMLSVIDQHWREHLYEMDYLQEGINLRAMGQQDPLSEWQREGFDMFEAMMGQIEDDFVRYVFHLQVVVDDEPRPRSATCRTARRWIRCRVRRRSRRRWPRRRPRCRSPSTTTMPLRWRCRPSRCSRCRCGPRRRRAATSRASAAAARSTSSATGDECGCVISRRSSADLARRVADAHKYLRIDEARARLAELEEQASAPDLWDDADRARQVTSEMSSVREDVELMDELDRRLSDVQTLYELAREEDDASLEPEIADASAGLARDLDKLELRARCSAASTTSATRSAKSTPARAAPTRRTGRRWCCA